MVSLQLQRRNGPAAKKPEMKYMKECVDIIVLDEVDEMVRNPGFFQADQTDL
jgi:hypothetical protein